MNIQEIRSKIDSAKNILLVLPYLIDEESVVVTSILCDLLSQKEKAYQIASTQILEPEYQDLLEQAGISKDKLINKISPISYIITAENLEERVNVTWNKNGNKLDLILIPERGEVDFNNLKFDRSGGIYDLVIVINSAKAEHLGNIYNNHRGLFAGYDLISIGKKFAIEDKEVLSATIENYSSTSEFLYENYSDLGGTLDSKIARLTVKGIIAKTDGLQIGLGGKTLEILSRIQEQFEVNIDQIIREFNAKLSKHDLVLEERVLKNLKVDEQRKSIYSVLTTADFNTLNFNPNHFKAYDFIPKSLKGDFKYAFIAYEKAINETEIVIKSLNPENDLIDLVEKFGGYPNTNYALIESNSGAQEASVKLLNALSGDKNQNTTVSIPAPQLPLVQENIAKEEPSLPEPVFYNQVNTAVNQEPIAQITEAEKTEEIVSIQNESQQTQRVQQEVVMQNELQSSQPAEQIIPPMHSPFTRVEDVREFVDVEAEPLKKSDYFSAQNTPFDKKA
jgi:hypothetical protein